MEKDRKSQLSDYNKRVNSLMRWVDAVAKNVTAVTDSEAETRQQEYIDLLVLNIEVVERNVEQRAALLKSSQTLRSKWGLFSNKWDVLQIEKVFPTDLPSGLSNKQEFRFRVDRQAKLVETLKKEFLMEPSEDWGLSQLYRFQCGHDRLRITQTMKNGMEELWKLRRSLTATGEWREQDEKQFGDVGVSTLQLDHFANLQYQWFHVMHFNQCFFKQAGVQEEILADILERSITGNSDQTVKDLVNQFERFCDLFQLSRTQLSHNLHWTPEKKKEMADRALQLKCAVEAVLANLKGSIQHGCVDMLFRQVYTVQLEEDVRSEMLQLLGKFFETPKHWKGAKGSLVEDFRVDIVTRYGEIKLGGESPPEPTGHYRTDKIMTEQHLFLRKLITHNAWIYAKRGELERNYRNKNVPGLMGILNDVNHKTFTTFLTMPQFGEEMALLKFHVENRSRRVWQLLAILKNNCIAAIEQLRGNN